MSQQVKKQRNPTRPENPMALTRENLERLIAARGEPDWMAARRRSAWERYDEASLPEWPRTDLSGLKLDAVEAEIHHDPGIEGAPAPLQSLVETAGTDAPLYVQLDSSPVLQRLGQRLSDAGVVLTDMHTALKEQPDLVQEYFLKDEPVSDMEKIVALHEAFWSGGIFLYVPPGVELDLPVHAFFHHATAGAGLFTHNLIVLGPNSRATYLEEYSSSAASGHSLHDGFVELYLEAGSRLRFVSLQNWGRDVYEFSTKNALIGRDAGLEFTNGIFGGALTRSVMRGIMSESGAQFENLGIYLGGGDQHMDIKSDSVHRAPHTTGETLARGVLKDDARSVFRGMIKIVKEAQDSTDYLTDNTLMLSEGARADAIPGLEIEADEVKASHGATMGQVDRDQLFYLTSRGLTEVQARRLIVTGFLSPLVERIPDEEAQRRVLKLIESKIEA